jgi:hypothetical protein
MSHDKEKKKCPTAVDLEKLKKSKAVKAKALQENQIVRK